ncbi:MAG: hypothetical protein AVDCRST_MAG67-1403, partial [uncultured Solirubrobacteraceae bacterium]
EPVHAEAAVGSSRCQARATSWRTDSARRRGVDRAGGSRCSKLFV